MLTPEAQASIDAHKGRQQGWIRGERPLLDSRFGARTIGAIAEITPGCEAWTRTDPLGDIAARGGIVVHVNPGQPDTISDDGEIVHHPARYRCHNPAGHWPDQAFVTISETEIDPATVAPASALSLVAAIRRFCREVGGIDRLRVRRTLDAHEAQLVTDAWRLVVALMGGTR